MIIDKYAILFCALVIGLWLVFRLIQWFLFKKMRANSTDENSKPEFAGSSGYRPGGVGFVIGGSEPIPVRRSPFRRGRKK